MTQTAEISTADWTAQAGLSADQLPARLRAHFRDLAQLDDEAIRATWERFLPAEAELADEALRRMTQARLRAFIGMEADQVQKLVGDLLTVRDTLPGPTALRLTTAMQTASRELELAELQQVLAVAPTVRRALSPEMRTTLDELERRAGGETESAIEKPETPAAARPWWNSTKWKFW